ncbi:MAG TPA: hypothetical protein VMV18_00665 [bacterium]|nr:hypothetical protein [bacterium]
MTLFRTPERPASLTFMLRGEPGTGKTRFALGLTRHAARKKPVAVIGAARGVSFQGHHFRASL